MLNKKNNEEISHADMLRPQGYITKGEKKKKT